MFFRGIIAFRSLKDRRGLSSLQRFFWYSIIIGATSLAFYYNFNYRMAKIDAKAAFYDESGSISPVQEQKILGFINILKKDFTTQSKIQIVNDDVFIPQLKSNDLYLGLSKNKEQAILILPNLMKKALTTEQKSALDSQILQCVALKNSQDNSADNRVDHLANCASDNLSTLIKYLNE